MEREQQRHSTATTGARAFLRFWPLAVLLALAVLVVAMGWHRALSVETLVKRRAELDQLVQLHYWAALAAFIGIYVVAVGLSIPGATLLTVSAGVLFGWLIGGLAAVTGATLGAALLFLLVRYAFSEFVRRRLGGRLAAIASGFREDAFSYLLFLRLVPVFPFWLVNLAPALAGVSLRSFFAATALGVVPATFAFASFGAGLDSVIAAQKTAYEACLAAGSGGCRLDLDLKAAVTPQLIAALTALGLAALIPVGVKRWRAARRGRQL